MSYLWSICNADRHYAEVLSALPEVLDEVINSADMLGWSGPLTTDSIASRFDEKGVATKLLRAVSTAVADLEASFDRTAGAPPRAALGRIAFGSERSDVPYEVDTPREDALSTSLYSHFSSAEELERNDADLLQSFMKKGWYSDVFHPPASKVVYRGLGVSGVWLRRALRLDSKELLDDKGTSDASFLYRPRPPAASSSWTTSPAVAWDFASKQVGRFDVEWRVVLHASTSDNNDSFIAGEGGLYRVDNFRSYDGEDEVLGLGQIHVFKVEWERADDE